VEVRPFLLFSPRAAHCLSAPPGAERMLSQKEKSPATKKDGVSDSVHSGRDCAAIPSVFLCFDLISLWTRHYTTTYRAHTLDTVPVTQQGVCIIADLTFAARAVLVISNKLSHL